MTGPSGSPSSAVQTLTIAPIGSSKVGIRIAGATASSSTLTWSRVTPAAARRACRAGSRRVVERSSPQTAYISLVTG